MEGIIKQKVLKIFSVFLLISITLILILPLRADGAVPTGDTMPGSWRQNHEPSEDSLRNTYLRRCKNMITPPGGNLVSLLDIKPWVTLVEAEPSEEGFDVYYMTAVLGTVQYNGEVYTEHPVELSARGNNPLGTDMPICIYGGADIDKNSSVGKQQPDSAHFTTEPVIRGTYTVRGIVDLDGADITWSDFYNWATDAVNGKEYLKGAASFEVREVATTFHGHPTKTIEVYQSGKKVSDTDKGVVLRLEKVTEGGIIEGAIKTAVGGMLQAVGFMISSSINLINELLEWTKNITLRENVQNVWLAMRNLSISLLVLVLVIIAFANTLQIRVEQYGVNRMIPKIIIAVVLAYFSWIIVMFFFDFASAIQGEAENIVSSTNSWDAMVPRADTGVVDSIAGIGNIVFLFVIFVIIMIALVALLFSLLVRAVILSFLVATAPLAIILSILPFTEKYYKKWWGEFFKWLFMGPLVVFVLALGTILAGTTPVVDGATIEGNNGDLFLSLFMLLGAIVFAASLPLTLGGKIMGQWQNLGKKTANWSASRGAERLGRLGMGKNEKGEPVVRNKALASMKYLSPDVLRSAWGNRKDTIKQRSVDSATELQGKLAGKGALGRMAAGATPEQVKPLQKKAVRNYLKNNDLSTMDPTEKNRRMLEADARGDTFMRDVYATDLSDRGQWSAGTRNLDESGKVSTQKIFDKLATSDMDIQNNVAKTDPEVLLASSDEGLRKRGLSGVQKSNITSWGSGTISGLADLAGGTTKEAATAREMLGRVDASQIERVASRGSQKQLEALTSPEVLSYLTPETRGALKQTLNKRGYSKSVAGGPSPEYQRVLDADNTYKAGKSQSSGTPSRAEEIQAESLMTDEQKKLSESRGTTFRQGAVEREQEETVKAGRQASPDEEYIPTHEETNAAESMMSEDQKRMTHGRSSLYREGMTQRKSSQQDTTQPVTGVPNPEQQEPPTQALQTKRVNDGIAAATDLGVAPEHGRGGVLLDAQGRPEGWEQAVRDVNNELGRDQSHEGSPDTE